MRTLPITIILFQFLSVNVYSQLTVLDTLYVSQSFSENSLEEICLRLEQIHPVRFFYDDTDSSLLEYLFSGDFQQVPMASVLEQLFSENGHTIAFIPPGTVINVPDTYTPVDFTPEVTYTNEIIIGDKRDHGKYRSVKLTGTIKDGKHGTPLVGVVVYSVESDKGAVSDHNGRYSISPSPGKNSLQYSSVGFEPIARQVEMIDSGSPDISIKNTQPEKVSSNAGIGLINARAHIEISLVAGVRNTYSDWILKRLSDPSFRESSAGLHEMIGKVKWQINRNNSLTVFGYQSSDRFNLAGTSKYLCGNMLGNIRYRHIFLNRLSLRVLGGFSRHALDMEPEQGYEAALYISDNFSVSNQVGLNVGFRYSAYRFAGPKTVYQYDEQTSRSDNTITDTLSYAAGERIDDQLVKTGVWIPDLGNGMYKNPILYADFSDPDVVRTGEDYYMTASSFNCVPGLPILHSKDLVNWTLINYALPRLYPEDTFNFPQHGKGVWAPSIRYHKGEFFIFYGDPDFGIYMTKTSDPGGEWSKPLLVKEVKGWIDPCPLWDDDGRAWLVHAFAGSRSGLKSILIVHEMRPDGSELLDEGVLVFDGHRDHRTVEGPKFYKKDGYYYIFAPAGGVPTGWQLALRSKDVLGPYEAKVVLHQGNTSVNGPHQGAWVSTPSGKEDWFIHFQDKEAYGRIVHLQPLIWKDGWPRMGIDPDNDGIGEPVSEYRKPDIRYTGPVLTPQVSDEFSEPVPGLQWQWHANPLPGAGFPSGRLGFLRLNVRQVPENYKNLWDVPNLLLQKFAAPEFTVTAKVEFYPAHNDDKLGLVVMGNDYAYLALVKTEKGMEIRQTVCMNAGSGAQEENKVSRVVTGNTFYLRVTVTEGAMCRFSYSTDNTFYQYLGKSFKALPGKWIGAKTGFFCTGVIPTNDSGYADIDWFRISEYQ